MNSSFFMMCLARGIVKMDVTEKLCVVLTLKDGTVVRLYNCNMDEIADFYDMLENYPQDRFIDRWIRRISQRLNT